MICTRPLHSRRISEMSGILVVNQTACCCADVLVDLEGERGVVDENTSKVLE
jgi:hypothetical protein